jgi:hypothetical protein
VKLISLSHAELATANLFRSKTRLNHRFAIHRNSVKKATSLTKRPVLAIKFKKKRVISSRYVIKDTSGITHFVVAKKMRQRDPLVIKKPNVKLDKSLIKKFVNVRNSASHVATGKLSTALSRFPLNASALKIPLSNSSKTRIHVKLVSISHARLATASPKNLSHLHWKSVKRCQSVLTAYYGILLIAAANQNPTTPQRSVPRQR